MLIDIHGHCLKNKDLPLHRGDEPFVWPELLLEMHREIGIDHGVLLPVIGPENTSVTQSVDEVLDIAHESNGHFIPFLNVDPRMLYNSPNADLSFIIEHYKARGCKGIGEVTANLSFTDPRCLNLFKAAEKNDMPVTIHIATREGDIYGLIDDLGLPRLEVVLQKFPGLKILGHSQTFWAHISADVSLATWGGYPRGSVVKPGRITELMRKYDNLLGDFSAGSGLNSLMRDPVFAYEFIDEFQDRLFYGTDLCQPKNRNSSIFFGLRDFLKTALEEKHISKEAYEKITHLNAERLLGL
ncbi:MAG: amidohydrolase family protein [Victivallales bacterium]|nr:amidohydrolase family protein [Victivallales bacterium]